MAERRNKRLISIAAATFAVIALFVAWYCVAANYDYDALAGVYVFERNDERCVLDLRADRSFKEQLSYSGNVRTQREHGIAMASPMFPFRRHF